MYVLDPLFITAGKELDEVHSLASSLMSRLDEMKKKEESKGKKKPSGDLANKVRESLKGNRYKDEQTGKDVSFGTAYSRGNAKARKDFSNAMGKAEQDAKDEDISSKDKKDEQPLPPPKSISQLDPKKVNDHAVKLLKAIRGHDKQKAVDQLKEIEEGSERGTIEALIAILSQPEVIKILNPESNKPLRTTQVTPRSMADSEPPKSTDQSTEQVKPVDQAQPEDKSKIQPADQSKPTGKKAPKNKSQTQPTNQAQPVDQSKSTDQAPPADQAQPEEKKTPEKIVIKPKFDLNRVKLWAKENGQTNLITKGLEKQIAELDVDMDDDDLHNFMESYSSTMASMGKVSHADKKKYRDADLGSIKDPKELAKVMAIKKEAQAYFDPLNGLGLGSVNLVQDIESEKQHIREAQQKRYSKMTPEDRLEMGEKLKQEIKKLNANTEEGKKKLALLESAYDGVIASALYQNDTEEMAKVFVTDSMANKTPKEQEEYKKKQEQKNIARNKQIESLGKSSKPLSKEEVEKKESNAKEIKSLSDTSKGVATKLGEIDKQVKEIDKQVKEKEKEIAKLKAEGKSTESIEKEIGVLQKTQKDKLESKEYQDLQKEHKELEKKITGLEKENKALQVRDVEGNEVLSLEYDTKIKGEIDAVKEKILKAQQDPKADQETLKQDIKAYKELMVKKEKALEAKSALKEYKKQKAKLESLNNEKIKEGVAYKEMATEVLTLSKDLKVLQDKKDANEALTPKEEEQYKALSEKVEKSKADLETIKKKTQIFKKEEEENNIIFGKRFPVDQNIVALVQTISDPKVLGALTEMTKAKDQPAYKENLRKVFDTLGDEDLMKVVYSDTGEKTPVQEMAKLLSPTYCPKDAGNLSSKNDDEDDEDGNKCKITLSYAQKKLVREHILDYISNDMFFSNADKGKTKSVKVDTGFGSKFEFDDEDDRPENPINDKQDEHTEREEEVIKHTEAFEKALLDDNLNRREETIKKIVTDLSLDRASKATKDEKVKAMIEAIKREKNTKKQEEYLKILQSNDSEPKLFENIKLGRDKNLNKVFINFNNNNKGQDFMKKKSTTITNYQEVASNFQIGMKVFPFFGGSKDHHGTVVAIYPAIGMVDVQFPFGSARYPVEDLQIADLDIEPVNYDSIPGGLGTKPVNAKTALYWADKDRKYRMCRDEVKPTCPRCKGIELKKTVYKRMGGKSERLLCCPECLFLIKTTDILGFNS